MNLDRLTCVIEIPRGSRNKYEYDPELGGIKLDRFVSSSTVYPTDYGYVPETLAADGDPLDAMVCVSEATFPGCIIPVEPIALFKLEDEVGIDDKVVCVPRGDPGWSGLERLDDLPMQLRNEIAHFFAVYKDLEPDRHSRVIGWSDRDEAIAALEESSRRYRERAGRQ